MGLWVLEIIANENYEEHINRICYEVIKSTIYTEFLDNNQVKVIVHTNRKTIDRIQNRIITFFKDYLTYENIPNFKCYLMEKTDWNEKWKNEFNCIEIENKLVIKPYFKDYQGSIKDIITINPSVGFGSGEHPTTQLMIEKIINLDINNRSILDIGSGSGILSIASLFFNPKKIQMIEIDNDACNNSKENFELNNMSEYYNIIEGDFYEDNIRDRIIGKFDIIYMNILPNIILNLVPFIPDFLFLNGILVISGIILNRLDEIKLILEQYNFLIENIKEKNNWYRLDCRLIS